MSEPIKTQSEPMEDAAPRYASLSDYLRAFRRRRRIVIAFTVGLAVLAALVSLRQDTVYEATSQITFRDPLRGLNFLPGGQSVPQESPVTRAAANAELITNPGISRAVKEALDTDLRSDTLASRITTQVGVQTNIVSITASAGDAQLAADISNEFAEQTRRSGIAADQNDFKTIEDEIEDRIEEVRDRDFEEGLEALQIGNLQNQLAQVRTIQAASESVEIVSRADVPDGPSAPATARNTVLGGLLGLVFGFVIAFVRDSLDRRVHSAQQIAQETNLPVLGRISSTILGRTGFGASGNGAVTDVEFESFRGLRMNLAALRRPGGNAPRTILVTSGLAQEGKSTVSISLASAAALAGQSVLLVECDLRRPVFEKRLGVKRSPGLADYLSGDVSPQDILQTIKVTSPAASGAPKKRKKSKSIEGDEVSVDTQASMIVVAAGSQVHNPAELLVSVRFADFIDKVSRAYDLVVIDSSPLLAVVDPLEIAPRVDGVLACVRTGQSTLDELRATRDALNRVEEKPIGIVVTGIKRGGPDSYDYYYGY